MERFGIFCIASVGATAALNSELIDTRFQFIACLIAMFRPINCLAISGGSGEEYTGHCSRLIYC